MAQVIDSDIAQALQARILANLKAGKMTDMPAHRPGDPCGAGALEAHIAALEKAVADAEALGEQRRQEAEAAAKRIEALETRIVGFEAAVAKAEAEAQARRQEAQAATERANNLVAELVEMTGELVEMSKRVSEQTTAMERMRAEFEDAPSLTWPVRTPGGGSP
jgi:DNA repair exonuclease SbcCD ATPase subunit